MQVISVKFCYTSRNRLVDCKTSSPLLINRIKGQMVGRRKLAYRNTPARLMLAPHTRVTQIHWLEMHGPTICPLSVLYAYLSQITVPKTLYKRHVTSIEAILCSCITICNYHALPSIHYHAARHIANNETSTQIFSAFSLW